MSDTSSTPNKRLHRTSNPTPPERGEYKKTRVDSSDLNTKMDDHFEIGNMPQHYAISSDDIQKIADAVKVAMLTDIEHIIESKTAPLISKIEKLEKENVQLKNDIDELEQYGRRNLIRISGIPESKEEGDTTETIKNMISKIDPHFRDTDVLRSHRVGKPRDRQNLLQKNRQIIVRLVDPSIKFRILKCRKNLKDLQEFRYVYINEDLTQIRSKILYQVRQLHKKKKIDSFWTTNGKILIKDLAGKIHNVSRKDVFLTAVKNFDPTFVPPDEF